MNQIKRLLFALTALCLITPATVNAQTISDFLEPRLIISEIKIKNDTTGFDEFIEITNVSSENIILNTYQIEYFNTPSPAADQQPIRAAIGDGILEIGKSFVLAKNETQIPQSKRLPLSSLSDSGGQIRLTDADDNIVDRISWTSTQNLAIAPINYSPSSSGTKSFHRQTDEAGSLVLDNPTWSLLLPAPSSNQLIPLPEPEPEPEPIPADNPSENPVVEPPVTEAPPVTETAGPNLLPLQISEILPNPAPPASDSTDEYIELHNPNTEPVDLNGYRLQSGNSFSYSHTFNEGTIGPGEYKAFYVIETGALLANSGGRVRLLDPSGQIVAETSPYDDATDGFAWSFVNNIWQWTTMPTPNALNTLSLPIAKSISAKATKTPKPTTTKSKAPKTAKVASAKTSKTKPKTTKAAKSSDNSGEDPEEVVSAIHPTVIAGVGLIALAYAIYEYRYDFANRIHQLRRYRETRAAARAKA